MKLKKLFQIGLIGFACIFIFFTKEAICQKKADTKNQSVKENTQTQDLKKSDPNIAYHELIQKLSAISDLLIKSASQVQNSPKDDLKVINEELIKKLSTLLSDRFGKTQLLISIMAIFISFFSIFWPLMMHLQDKKRWESFNELFKEKREQLSTEKENQFLNDLLKRDKEISESIHEKLNRRFQIIDCRIKSQINNLAEPLEKRLLQIEYVKKDFWNFFSSQLSAAGVEADMQKEVAIWTRFFKVQLALAQINSSKVEDIFTGLGTFLGEIETGALQVTKSFWELIEVLKSQRRLEDPRTISLAEKIGESMGYQF